MRVVELLQHLLEQSDEVLTGRDSLQPRAVDSLTFAQSVAFWSK